MKLYKGKKTFSETDEKLFLKKLEELKFSGLNEILLTYKAPNGENQLKESFHKKFAELPSMYFFKRPIDHEFLEYSVRDVEDLVDVYFNINQELEGIVKDCF